MIYTYYKNDKNYKTVKVFETFDKSEFYTYMVSLIESGQVTYDCMATYPSKEKQLQWFYEDFQVRDLTYYQHFSPGWVEVTTLDPNKNRDLYIREKLYEHYQEALQQGYEIFGIFVQGSQNYGLDIYSEEYWSDIDTKCIVLPSLDDIILNRKPISTTHERENKEHIDFKDIRLMWECFKKQNVNFMEILFTDYYIVPEKYKKYWDKMRELAEEIAHAHPAQTVRTMSGMSMEKFKALEHRYPTLIEKIDKYGYDGKQLHHIIRINDFIKRYTMGLSFKEALTPTAIMVKQMNEAKLNKYSLEVARELAMRYDDETKFIKDSYIEMEGDKVNESVYNSMDQIKAQILKDYFKQEILKSEKNC